MTIRDVDHSFGDLVNQEISQKEIKDDEYLQSFKHRSNINNNCLKNYLAKRAFDQHEREEWNIETSLRVLKNDQSRSRSQLWCTCISVLVVLSGPDSSSGRASASRAEGRRFKTRPRHTKGVKNGTSGYLAWRSAL